MITPSQYDVRIFIQASKIFLYVVKETARPCVNKLLNDLRGNNGLFSYSFSDNPDVLAVKTEYTEYEGDPESLAKEIVKELETQGLSVFYRPKDYAVQKMGNF